MGNAFKVKIRWSSLAINFCVAIIAFAIGNGAHWALRSRPPQSTPQQPPPPPQVSYPTPEAGTLRASILKAKARGNNTVQFGAIGCGSDIGSLRTALSRDTVVLAELVGKKTYEEKYGLHTWYRFKTKETLLKNAPPRVDYLLSQSAPSDMLPIAEDEFLVQEANGRMEIDGVTVIQVSNGPGYVEHQTYLLFLLLDPSKRIATRSGTDPLGVFLVDDEENLRPYVDHSYPLKTHIARRFKNSVSNMRQALKK